MNKDILTKEIQSKLALKDFKKTKENQNFGVLFVKKLSADQNDPHIKNISSKTLIISKPSADMPIHSKNNPNIQISKDINHNFAFLLITNSFKNCIYYD